MKTLTLLLLLMPIACYSQGQPDTTVHLDSLTKAEFNRYEDDFGITAQRSAEYFKAHRVKMVDSIAPKSLETPLSRYAIEEVGLSHGSRDTSMEMIDPLTGRKGSLQDAISRLVISEVDVVTGTPPEDTIHWLRPLPASEIIKMLPR